MRFAKKRIVILRLKKYRELTNNEGKEGRNGTKKNKEISVTDQHENSQSLSFFTDRRSLFFSKLKINIWNLQGMKF